jgi:ribosomal protein uL22
MVYKYAFQGFDEAKMARAVGISLKGLSRKDGVEVAKFIKGMDLDLAISYLEGVFKFKRAIPYTRYNWGLSHQKGKVGSGRYPMKACEHFLKVLKSAKANANNKNLNVDNLIIKGACVQKAPDVAHYGRHSGRIVKQAHLEIVLCEKEEKKDDKKEERRKKRTQKNTKKK